MGGTLWFPANDDTHVVSGNTELSQNKIFRDSKVFTVTTAVEKFDQRLPLVSGPGTRTAAIIDVALPVDIAIDQLDLLLEGKVGTAQ